MGLNPFLMTDGYKTGHVFQYPNRTSLVYDNLTPRSIKYAPKGCDKIVVFGPQMATVEIKDIFDTHFFKTKERKTLENYRGTSELPEEMYQKRLKELKDPVIEEIKEEYSMYLGTEYNTSHIEELWDIGFLPITIKSLPEGSIVDPKIPVMTIYNDRKYPSMYWIPNFLETIISNLIWKPMTSASIAFQYKKNLVSWAKKTDIENVGSVVFQGHDFSMRGLDSIYATQSSGLGHGLYFLGSDSLPVIHGARKYYYAKGPVVHSVNATEHSVMCAGGKETELDTFSRLLDVYPKGILSVVSDTWDLWHVITVILPQLKDRIMSRDGKIVIRPDSGDPVDIICGTLSEYKDLSYLPEGEILPKYFEDTLLDEVREETPHGELGVSEYENIYVVRGRLYKAKIHNISWNRYDKQYYYIDMYEEAQITVEELELKPQYKGVIELLWDIFGGTVNEQEYKVLDPHIGAIYGDSITLERAEEICKRLEAKGFASTNIVLGVGSFTYQYNTRDTFGFAVKATYVELTHPQSHAPVVIETREIFKDPVTDDGMKKSAKGLLRVDLVDGVYVLKDQCTWEEESGGELQPIFINGELVNQVTYEQVREKANSYIK